MLEGNNTELARARLKLYIESKQQTIGLAQPSHSQYPHGETDQKIQNIRRLSGLSDGGGRPKIFGRCGDSQTARTTGIQIIGQNSHQTGKRIKCDFKLFKLRKYFNTRSSGR